MVAQECKHIVAIDFDPKFIADATERASKRWPIDLRIHDILRAPLAEKFDGAYAMDVMEHIPKDKEDQFLKNICSSLDLMAG